MSCFLPRSDPPLRNDAASKAEEAVSEMPAGTRQSDLRCVSPGQAAITRLPVTAGFCPVSCLVISASICDLAQCPLSIKCTTKFNSRGWWLSEGAFKRKVYPFNSGTLVIIFFKT